MDQENINRILGNALEAEGDSVQVVVSPEQCKTVPQPLSKAAIADLAASFVEIEERVGYKLNFQKIKDLLPNESNQIQEILDAINLMGSHR